MGKHSVFSKIGILALSCVFIASPSNTSAALLNTEYIDNDHGKINSIRNDYWGGTWTYEKSSSGYLGDHRFNSGTTGTYAWKTYDGKGGNYKALSVHLRNAKFTNPSAYYKILSGDLSYGLVYGTKNQNTAPNGWSRVVDKYGYGEKPYPSFSVNANGYKNTGADGIKVEFYDKKPSSLIASKKSNFNYEEVKPNNSLNKTVDLKNMTKENIHYKMLNSIDYFNTISGNFDYTSESAGYKYHVEYNVDMVNPKSQVKVTGNDGLSKESIFNGDGSLISLNNKERSYSISETPNHDEVKKIRSESLLEGESPINRYSINDDGEKIYDYRIDPAFMDMAQNSLFPQEIALGYLEEYSKWDIKNTEKINGLDAIFLGGELNEYYQAKHKVKTFKLWVHAETGILLKMEEYNEKGQATESLVTNSIKINVPIKTTNFNIATPKNYIMENQK